MAAPTASTAPVVLVTQKAAATTLSYLQGRGLQVLSVPAEDHRSHQDYNAVFERARGAVGLLAFPCDVVDAQLIKECGALHAVSVAGERADCVDLAACTASGVAVAAVDPALSAAATAELAVGLAIALQRRLLAGDAAVRGGGFAGWRPSGAALGGLAGAAVAVIGWGALAAALTQRLAAFGPASITFCEMPGAAAPAAAPEGYAPLKVHAPPPSSVAGVPVGAAPALPALLAACDVIFLAAPFSQLGPSCRHVIGAPALATVKADALLINVAAGGFVDEKAVADALDSGKLGGYAADVFECEDVIFANRKPEIEPRLLAAGARTVLSPHAGGQVSATRQRCELEAARALSEALDGRRPAGALNDVPPRRPGTDAPGGAPKPRAGLLEGWWCW